MSDYGLNIAASALDADRVGMNTVADDLANINTPYFARQQVNLSAVQGSSSVSGGGVMVPSVSMVSNSIYTAAALTADGLLTQQQALNQVLTQVQATFPEPNGGGIQSQLAAFWSAWDNIATEPSNVGARQAVVSDAGQMATSFNQAANALTTLWTETFTSLSSQITTANSDLSQIAALNLQVVEAQAGGGDANSLIAQRTNLLDQVSQAIGATFNNNADGSVSVYLGGLELVQGNNLLQQTPPNPNVLSVGTTGGGTVLATATGSAALAASTNITGANNTLVVTAGGTTYTITLTVPAGGTRYTPAGLVTAVNNAISAAGASGVVTASLNGGNLMLTAGNSANGSSLSVNGALTTLPTMAAAVLAGGLTPKTATVTYTADPAAPVSDIPLGGTAGGLMAALSKVSTYQGNLDQTAFSFANKVNTQQANGFYWAGTANSLPSASGGNAYAGNVDTSFSPLSIYTSGGTASITASTIGVDSRVSGNPFYLAASNLGPTASSLFALNLPVVITAGVNDTLNVTANGAAFALTIAAGTYTAAQLATAINNAITAAGAPLVASASSGNILSISVNGVAIGGNDTIGGSGPPTPSNLTLTVTGGNALGTLGFSTVAPTAQQNNGLNAASMAEVGNLTAGPDAIYRQFMSQLGTDVKGSTTQMNTQQALTTQSDKNFQGISGVSSDEETVLMQQFQNAYQAAAKVVTAIEASIQSLLAAV